MIWISDAEVANLLTTDGMWLPISETRRSASAWTNLRSFRTMEEAKAFSAGVSYGSNGNSAVKPYQHPAVGTICLNEYGDCEGFVRDVISTPRGLLAYVEFSYGFDWRPLAPHDNRRSVFHRLGGNK